MMVVNPKHGAFAVQKSRVPDPAYLAFPVLVEMTDNGKLKLLSITDLSPVEIRNVLVEPEIKKTYRVMENRVLVVGQTNHVSPLV